MLNDLNYQDKIFAKIESCSSNGNFKVKLLLLRQQGLVAQLDNAPGYGPGD